MIVDSTCVVTLRYVSLMDVMMRISLDEAIYGWPSYELIISLLKKMPLILKCLYLTKGNNRTDQKV